MPIVPPASLTEIVAALAAVDAVGFDGQEPVIYAAEPWCPKSEAVVEWSAYKGGLPDIAAKLGLVRLLEVDLARKFLGARIDSSSPQADAELAASDLIRHAQHLIAVRDPYGFNSKGFKGSPT